MKHVKVAPEDILNKFRNKRDQVVMQTKDRKFILLFLFNSPLLLLSN